MNSAVPVSVRSASVSGSFTDTSVPSTRLIRSAETCARGKSTNIIINIINAMIICEASIIKEEIVGKSVAPLLMSEAPIQYRAREMPFMISVMIGDINAMTRPVNNCVFVIATFAFSNFSS